MVAVVILLVAWLAGLTVGLLILAIQVNHAPQVVDQEREAAAGMFDLVRGEVQDAVDTMRRGDWEETRHNLEHVLMYTEAVATFWRRRAMERGGSTAQASSHTRRPGTAAGCDLPGARGDGLAWRTPEGSRQPSAYARQVTSAPHGFPKASTGTIRTSLSDVGWSWQRNLDQQPCYPPKYEAQGRAAPESDDPPQEAPHK